jgi:EAL domain-containing protein (putative c-di-GMP-specific phosphodiesterase class I)
VQYQPKVSLTTGVVTGLEALVRWRDPELGLVLPGEFIPIAEETGLIVPLSDWVARAVCEQLAAWRERGLRLVPIAVNLSAHQFRTGKLEEKIGAVLRDTGVAPELLELEITESTLMQDEPRVVAALEALRAAGLRISIDDFGTGYSSLAYLRRLPVDTLKVDRSFVQGIADNEGDAALTAAIVSMARALGLRTVAEGVETEAQRDLLRSFGCDEMQGWLVSKAVPGVEIEVQLRD